jgi:hypothetical protein
LSERTVDLQIEQAFAELKTILLARGCNIITEKPPKLISVKHGSLWGISPRTAKKTVSYHLSSVDSETRITYSSKLASDWTSLTVIGSGLAVLVASLCLWVALDLKTFTVTQEPSYWSWIVTVDGFGGFLEAQILANLMISFTVFLAIILAVEITIFIYVFYRINAFAEEILRTLGLSQSHPAS